MKRLPSLALAACALAFSVHARADGAAAECVANAEQGQKLQGQGRLLEAKEKFLACGRDACPKVIRTDCTTFEGQVEAALPSIVFAVKDEKGNDLTQVSVIIDGVPALDQLSGTATPINPGSHTFFFRREGFSPIKATALVRAGEKNRVVNARWGGVPTVETGATGTTGNGTTGSSTPHETQHASRSPVGWVLLGLGAVLAGVGTYGLVAGLGETSTLKSGCAMSLAGCTSGQIDSAQTKLWVGDIATPLGGVAIAAGIFFLLRSTDAPSSAPTTGWNGGALPGGGFVSWTRAF
jgi:hypothetical protein